ncbi:ras-related protein Rab-24-like [Xenia sp. Carnegie-2017]|uniref:ras-related protein Rab-24-like n=1 Tax=Xenia sp. Carnegie-2017 TaxID=2897299 RepID=UPI001F03FA5E|nr:ras-related protein Rab-24-like [Xenia sp. Carnegie-2017]
MANKVDAKVVLLGKEYSGKTCLVERYLHARFNKDVPYQNVNNRAAFGAKREFTEKSLTLGIWDTAGSERYEAMSRIYYRGAMAAIICYDLTDSTSFDKVKFWVNELKTHEESCNIFLCGTKADLVHRDKSIRQVDYHTTTDYADEIEAKVFETSSLTGENVGELFYDVAKTCLEKPALKAPIEMNSLSLEEPRKKRHCFCS